jgi:D-arabinose 1-dehydrogenase-like Zn-dependent alcohol dehydrogenase
MATKMRSVQVASAKGDFELVERDIPEPGAGAVRLKIQACGICHSDSIVKEGTLPAIRYPRVPGHEIAGIIDAIGAGVRGWTSGQRAGIGWHGGHCGYCDSCRRGDFITCRNAPQVPGITYDGGYADYMVAPAEALALIPDDLSAVEAAPMMCAGITTFNSLRHSGARPIAIARGADKEALAKTLGARRYIDSQASNPAEELMKLGGAAVILATATSGKAFESAVDGLAIGGTMIVLGAADPMTVSPLQLLSRRRSIAGWPSGRSIDSQDTLRFSALTGVRSMNEVFPLERAAEAYERMMSGKARFRVVLTTGQ